MRLDSEGDFVTKHIKFSNAARGDLDSRTRRLLLTIVSEFKIEREPSDFLFLCQLGLSVFLPFQVRTS